MTYSHRHLFTDISMVSVRFRNLDSVADIWNYVICSGSIIKNYRRDNGKAFTDNVYNSSKIKPADEADEEVVTAEGEIMEKAAN
jgi:hypothetical protein